eukprot:Colp12_sorted_trinity150504_noHs@7934
MAKPNAPRNTMLPSGVAKLSRSAVYRNRGIFNKKKKATVAKPTVAATTKTKVVRGDKNGGSRVVPVKRASRFYPTEDVARPLVVRKSAAPAKLRSTITPGSVLIVLSGPHRGRRVVFLKQLPSGLLLVTGPFKLNGVPLRRIDQAYVAATSTKVDLSGLAVDAKFDDKYFKREKKEGEEKKVSETRVADQKSVDKAVLEAVSKVPQLAAYLRSSFTLTNGQYPHKLKL